MVTLKHLLLKNVKCRNLLENDAGGGSVSGLIAVSSHGTHVNTRIICCVNKGRKEDKVRNKKKDLTSALGQNKQLVQKTLLSDS